MKIFHLLLITILVSSISFSQEVAPKVVNQIHEQLANLRLAHLNSDLQLAEQVYHNDLLLTSQSGKKYGKNEVLANIKNAFEYYENEDITFLSISPKVVLTNYINERKFKGFDKGKFRLTAIWKKTKGQWKIISMQSSRIKEMKT